MHQKGVFRRLRKCPVVPQKYRLKEGNPFIGNHWIACPFNCTKAVLEKMMVRLLPYSLSIIGKESLTLDNANCGELVFVAWFWKEPGEVVLLSSGVNSTMSKCHLPI